MGFYNVINPSSMQAGQPEDVSQVLANLNAIATVLNGGIDNANIASAAALAPSKFAAGAAGQVLGMLAGVPTWLGGFGRINDKTVTPGPDASIVFSSIPQTYAHLFGIWTAMGSQAGSGAIEAQVQLNGDTGGTAYFRQLIAALNTTVSASNTNTSVARIGLMGQASAGPGSGIFFIPHYASSTRQKPMLCLSGNLNVSVTTMQIEADLVYYNNASAITQVAFFPQAGSLLVGTRLTLYGLG